MPENKISNISLLAGKPPQLGTLVDIPKLITAYYSEEPDPKIEDQRVVFGTSGHRGSSFRKSFNEWHILAITQAICFYRKQQGINGPLFLGIDTHALSQPARASALEVLGANGVELMLASNEEYTPTPVISHAILTYNRGRKTGLADGIVVTPSHNPPHDGGFKYNPPHGGPAGDDVTDWIQSRANALIEAKLQGVKRMLFDKALCSAHKYDFLNTYVADLGNIIDMEKIQRANLKIGVDPLGGAGVHYWGPIAERYKLDLEIISKTVDPTFRFMSLDWDGQIRMDPSSVYAMQRLIGMKDSFDLSFACDTDYDRHGIVTKSGLMPPNHYLSVLISYLFQHRTGWPLNAAAGKTVVTTQMIDRIAAKLGRKVFEVPVGFKWFVDGLMDASLGVACEESAGASFLRRDGSLWTTDKDGIVPALLAAEITAHMGKDPAAIYGDLTKEFGEAFADRFQASASHEQKRILKRISASAFNQTDLAGEKIKTILTKAPGNDAPIGGLKVSTENGWFAARPSGTEDIYKIYAESFRDSNHLQQILEEAHQMVDGVLKKEGRT